MSAVSIDAHQHFWDPALADYPWMTGQMTLIARQINRAYATAPQFLFDEVAVVESNTSQLRLPKHR